MDVRIRARAENKTLVGDSRNSLCMFTLPPVFCCPVATAFALAHSPSMGLLGYDLVKKHHPFAAL